MLRGEMSKNYSDIDLLNLLLHGSFSNFKKVGEDDWQNPSERNASFSLSSKRYIAHKNGISGRLNSLAKEHNLPILNNGQSA